MFLLSSQIYIHIYWNSLSQNLLKSYGIMMKMARYDENCNKNKTSLNSLKFFVVFIILLELVNQASCYNNGKCNCENVKM